MRSKKYKWYKIAQTIEEIDFHSNNLLEIEIESKIICLAKTSKGLSACAAKCPHAGGIMCEGFVDKNDHIVCPIHRYAFNFANGRDVTGEGYYLKTFPVEVKDNGIFLGIEEADGLFNWLK